MHAQCTTPARRETEILIPADTWRTLPTDSGKHCRYTHCGGSAVAETLRSHRGTGGRWWAYCSAHLYGKVIVAGVVMKRVPVEGVA